MSIKLPHMPLYVYDIDTDRECRRMSDAEFGRYMRLLIRQWMEGSVPAKASDAILDAGLDHGSDTAVMSILDRKFAKAGSERKNAKLETIRIDCLHKVEVNRENGSKGGRPKNNPSVSSGLTETKPNGSIRASDSGSGSDSQGKGDARGKPIELPDLPAALDTPEVRQALLDWFAYKRERGEGYKPRGAKALVTRLSKFSASVVVESVSQSMSSNWAGLFPDKVTSKPGSTGPKLRTGVAIQ